MEKPGGRSVEPLQNDSPCSACEHGAIRSFVEGADVEVLLYDEDPPEQPL